MITLDKVVLYLGTVEINNILFNEGTCFEDLSDNADFPVVTVHTTKHGRTFRLVQPTGSISIDGVPFGAKIFFCNEYLDAIALKPINVDTGENFGWLCEDFVRKTLGDPVKIMEGCLYYYYSWGQLCVSTYINKRNGKDGVIWLSYNHKYRNAIT